MSSTSFPSIVQVGPHAIGPGRPLAYVAGPCVIETADHTLFMAQRLAEIAERTGVPLVFKASFDKANRTRIDGFRGPGLDEGCRILQRVREQTSLPITTDIHLPDQAGPVSDVVDLLQIPAFLCRQTDLLVAAARTGTPVNVKKGQFVAPPDMVWARDKLAGAAGVLITERGTAFGHRDLVVDFRGLPELAGLGVPVVFDATHSTQRPSASNGVSGGDRRLAPLLARAAVATGVDAVFFEVHDHPDRARSDAASQMNVNDLEPLIHTLTAIREATYSATNP